MDSSFLCPSVDFVSLYKNMLINIAIIANTEEIAKLYRITPVIDAIYAPIRTPIA